MKTFLENSARNKNYENNEKGIEWKEENKAKNFFLRINKKIFFVVLLLRELFLYENELKFINISTCVSGGFACNVSSLLESC